MVAAVVLAGGGGTRFGATQNKVFLPLAGRRVVTWSLAAMASAPSIGEIVLTVRHEDRALAAEILDAELPGVAVTLVEGGDTRHASEHNALRHLQPRIATGDIDVVLIHDGARPLVSARLICDLIAAARDVGGAIPGIAAGEIAMVTTDAGHERLAERFTAQTLVRVQTPQAFRGDRLLAAYAAAAATGFAGSDTSSCIEHFTDATVMNVPGDETNIKVTYPLDLIMAEQIVASSGRADLHAPVSRRGESNP